MEIKIFEILNAGGNLATMALLYVMWKFDRRLLKIEIKSNHQNNIEE